jgi:methanogenic corrinoid protein MtbC1
VLALARQGEFPRGDLAVLNVKRRRRQGVEPVAASHELWQALKEGEGARVRALIHGCYRCGMALESLADQIIAPALARLGHAWRTEAIDVWEEHRGTQLCAAALYDLKDELETRAERNRPVALGGAPEGDPYLLATLLAQYVLLDAGWEAVNLGPNTPLCSLAKALRELRPRLLWLSVSHLNAPSEFIGGYQELYRLAEQHGVAVAVGGQALVEPIRAAIPYTMHGDGMYQLAAFGRSLHPRPRRPRRGRPPVGI